MNDSGSQTDDDLSALFASLVAQQASMALLLMGRVEHPEGNKPVKDLEAARLFIDHLEMLEKRTVGNLTREEDNYLKQTLMNLRLAFVQSVETPPPAEPKAAPAPEGVTGTPASPRKTPGTRPVEAPAADSEEHQKKFSKKY